MHDLYKSALALRILFYFIHLLYIYSSPYSTRGTHYRLIEYITFRALLCVTHKDHLAVLTLISSWINHKAARQKLEETFYIYCNKSKRKSSSNTKLA
jgi:hypothetical protein